LKKLDDDDLSFKAGKNVLLVECPDLMALVGLIAAEWAKVEEELAFLYDYLLAQRGEPKEFGHSVDGLGVATLYAVESNRTRESMLLLAVEWRMGLDAVEHFKINVIAPLNVARKGRNRIAHARMFVSEKYHGALILRARDGEYYRVTENWLRGVVDSIYTASEAVQHFHHKVARPVLQKI
jgi:hypothetical protein